ncbi:MAG: DUF4430 domain-containing protein [Candidatus Zixiibacteriota bacterium]|nr:MAG: DUF4430 domain-containing protein [candidate division Zixibacteria bacterium]
MFINVCNYFFLASSYGFARAVTPTYTPVMPGSRCNLSRRLMALVVTVLALSVLTGCGTKQQSNRQADIARDSLVVIIPVPDSSSVLEATLATHDVDFLSTASGAFVKAIDSIPGTDGYYWLYSVNGRMGKVAADRFGCGPGDTIRWHFRRAE